VEYLPSEQSDGECDAVPIDLNAYRDRIGYDGPLEPTADVLAALHFAHATHIPFENLDVLLRRPIRLDIASLWAKLVTGGRGGYCFEQNAVFAAVLEAAGFRVRRLAARVRFGATGIRPRSHMALLVEVEGDLWLADVGFGGDGLLHPLPFRPGEAVEQFAWKYRLVAENPNYVVQSWRPDGWLDLYSFGLEEHYPIDYEVANYFTSTYPDGYFLRFLLAQLPGPERRIAVINRKLVERTSSGVTETPIDGDEALLATLAGRFGLVFPSGTRFPFDESL
jgi:N-hydroxyarylamine O-acetyltransferase